MSASAAQCKLGLSNCRNPPESTLPHGGSALAEASLTHPTSTGKNLPMDSLFKPGMICGAVLLAIAVGYTLFFKETDRQKFDRLEIGMTSAEVRDVLFPPTGGKYGHMRMDIGDEQILHLNDVMIVTMAGGQLVHKEWTGPEPTEPAKTTGY
jgi:hypothetical protein